MRSVEMGRRDKIVTNATQAVADIADGATIVIGGFGVIQGWPTSLIRALHDRGTRHLTVILNSPGVGPTSPRPEPASGTRSSSP